MSDRQNRRNYYRILHVQPDAPGPILKSSYRALMRHLEMHPDRGGDHWNASLVNEAYEVLSDPERRREYDATIDFMQVARGRPAADTDSDSRSTDGSDTATGPRPGGSAQGGPARGAEPGARGGSGDASAGTTDERGAPSGGSAPTDAARAASAPPSSAPNRFRRPTPAAAFDRTANVHEVEHSECLFCGSRYAMTVANPPSIVCAQCKSPMTLAGAPVLDDPGRRAARRIEREGSIRFYEEWPQDAGRPGRIADLSPVGMRFMARTPVEEYHIIKIEGSLLDAVASVANCRPTDDGLYAVGVQFYTVRFNQARGTFLSTEA